jgi:hypothetical protein
LSLAVVISYHLFAPPSCHSHHYANAIPQWVLERAVSLEQQQRVQDDVHGVPAFEEGGWSAGKVPAILPATICEDFVNINLTKNEGKAGSVHVLVYK